MIAPPGQGNQPKIHTAGSKRIYPPANRCIYCGKDDVPLTLEHIIPFGFGGNWEFPKASCKPCAKIINEQFETPLMRGYFFPARVHLGFPTRNRDPRPEAFQVKFVDDGSLAVVPINDHPSFLYLPIFRDDPKILHGRPTRGTIDAHRWYYVFQPDMAGRLGRIGRGRAVIPTKPLRAGNFFRLLAKIGHGYAAAEAVKASGILKYKALATDLILGEAEALAAPDLLLGGLPDTLQPKDDFHDVWLSSIQTQQGTFLVANVQLFANIQGPIYRVVVGQFPPGSTGLGRRYQTTTLPPGDTSLDHEAGEHPVVSEAHS